MPILTIFSQKSAILDNFLLLKVKNMGKFFHKFFADLGEIKIFGRIFTYAFYLIVVLNTLQWRAVCLEYFMYNHGHEVMF